MKINCPNCGMIHEVSKSHENAQMFCLGCDNFFRIEKNTKTAGKNIHSDTMERRVEVPLAKKDKILFRLMAKKRSKKNWRRLKQSMRRFVKSFVLPKKIRDKSAFVPEIENKRKVEEIRSTEPKAAELINNFLDPKSDLAMKDETAPAEYVDFLNAGLDAFSSELLENHNRKK